MKQNVTSCIFVVVVVLLCGVSGQVYGADCQEMFAQYKEKGSSIRKIKSVERCFERMIKKNPDGVAGYIGLAEVKYRQADFYAALHQLDLARSKDATKQERCTIEWLASWIYGHLGTSAAKGVYRRAVKACHNVDPDKEAVARMFLKNSKKKK